VVVGFSACQMESSGGAAPPPVPSATVSLCESGNSDCSPQTSFSVGQTRDIAVNISWENVPAGNHIQKLEILIPGGGLYQETDTAFAVPVGSAEPIVATRSLPVGGTSIQQRQITGEWTMRVSLDDQVIASQTVQLTP
jgi:hypothetical protein